MSEPVLPLLTKIMLSEIFLVASEWVISIIVVEFDNFFRVELIKTSDS